MIKKIIAAVDSIGLSYITMMLACIAAVIYDLFSYGTSLHITNTILYVPVLAIYIYCMWARSTSGLRTPIAVLMLAEGIFATAYTDYHHSDYSWLVQLGVDILWVIGICLMYTGPRLVDVFRGLRAQAPSEF